LSSSSLDLRVRFPEKAWALTQPARYKVCYGGRGSAKSWTIARINLLDGVRQPLRILCGRETQRSIAESVHHLLASQVQALGLSDCYRVQETGIYGRNGTEFAFAGLRQQGITNIKSYEDFDRAWIEEGQVVTKRSWEVLTPTIRKPGSEIWVSLNPELDTDYTYQHFVAHPPVGAVVVRMNWRDNPWFPAELEAERLACEARDPEGYRNIWEGEPRSVVEGAIYAREVVAALESRRIRPVPYDPGLKAHTVWDLGWNDATAIVVVQRAASEVRVVDYLEGSYKRLDEWVSQLERLPYRWGNDYLPHDGAAQQLNAGGKSAQEILKGLGRRPVVITRKEFGPGATDPEARILAARMMFPRVYFDETKAGLLVERLKRYRRRVNATTLQPEGPLHDETSHGADAFGALALVVDRLTNDEDWKPIDYPNAGQFV
jgi:phage terminase large subunit